VADLYSPQFWVDGQQLTAVNSANRWENGIEAMDVQQDFLTGQVSALQSQVGSGRPVPSGTTANRPPPVIGQPYWDISLTPPRLIMGNGSAWVNVDGTAITDGGGTGSIAGPTNMQATVTSGGTIGTIHLTWDAVPGATTYKLYETESPTGVSGATALTTTFSDRSPSTARNYDYWVTALVGGVESATSNHAQAILPFGSTGGTGGGGTGGTGSTDPTTFLNIDGKGTGTGGWFNLGIGFSTGHVDIAPTELQAGYVNSPYYTMNSAGNAVQMQVFCNGGTTSANTKYPRCEFREYAVGSTSTKAAWSGSSGHHIMRGATKLMHIGPNKPECTIAQMHDSADDTLGIKVIGTSASGPFDWKHSILGASSVTMLAGVPLGTEVAWDIDVNNGVLTIKLNGVVRYTGTPGFGSGQYFKTGCYIQQNVADNGNPSTEYGRIELRNLFVSHT
jgi:hypothetical protein